MGTEELVVIRRQTLLCPCETNELPTLLLHSEWRLDEETGVGTEELQEDMPVKPTAKTHKMEEHHTE